MHRLKQLNQIFHEILVKRPKSFRESKKKNHNHGLFEVNQMCMCSQEKRDDLFWNILIFMNNKVNEAIKIFAFTRKINDENKTI